MGCSPSFAKYRKVLSDAEAAFKAAAGAGPEHVSVKAVLNAIAVSGYAGVLFDHGAQPPPRRAARRRRAFTGDA